MFISLDTNVLYTLINRKLLGINDCSSIDIIALNKFISTQETITIPSCVFVEMITRFRNEPDKIKMIVDYLIGQKFNISSTGTIDIFKNPILKNGHIDYQLVDNYFNKKIKSESELIHVMLIVIENSYFQFLLQQKGLPSWKIDLIASRYLENIVLPKSSHDQTRILLSLIDGYRLNEVEKRTKEVFLQLLYEECQLYYIMAELITDDNYPNNSDEYENLKQAARTTMQNIGITQGTNIHNAITFQMNNSTNFVRFVGQVIPNSLHPKGYSQLQTDYMLTLLESWVSVNRRIRKNDVYDIYLLGAIITPEKMRDHVKKKHPESFNVYDCQTALLTFDRTMIRFLQQNHPTSYLLADQFLM